MIDILATLKQVKAIMTDDHFVGTKGPHFSIYINKDALYPHIAETSAVCAQFAEQFVPFNADIVAGPALGGIILSQWTAYHLGLKTGKPILSVYAEKKEGDLQLTRGYDALVKGKNVVVVEDLTTTGGSLKQAIAAVQQAGGNVVAAAVMVNKNPTQVTSEFFGVPFFALTELPVELYSAEDCPLCKSGVPINTTIGHGQKFLDSKK
ncbi:MAG: phosphoribosyltransferase [Candidatus Kerfeldbacteria bacterium]|nr:phosphoribosyltransferase [Candidatus Kerfeldbacteria bacterium]